MVPTVESIEKLKVISNKEKKEDKIQAYRFILRQYANILQISGRWVLVDLKSS